MSATSYALVRPELIVRLLPWAAGLAASAYASWRSGRALTGCRRRAVVLRADEQGTSELEFALAFPIFLVSVLITIQIALLLNAQLVVDYAAFCAARSAAVWVPQDLPDEPPNSIASDEESSAEKRTRIRRAAAVATLAVSPRLSTFLFGSLMSQASPSPLDGASLGRLAAAAAIPPDPRIDYVKLGVDVVDKYLYSELFTAVELVGDDGEPRVTFTPAAPITARVTHKFEMAVPFAGHVLGAAFGDRFVPFVGPYYIPLTASYTLLAAHV